MLRSADLQSWSDSQYQKSQYFFEGADWMHQPAAPSLPQ